MNWDLPRTGRFLLRGQPRTISQEPADPDQDDVRKAIGVVKPDAQLDATIGMPNYFPRLWKTFYYYGTIFS